METTEAEIINPNAIEITDNGKAFEIVKKDGQTDIEQILLHDENFVPMLEQVKKIARGLVADVHTKEGIEARKSLNRKLAGLKNAIEDEGKKVAAALKAKPKIVDATRKRVKDTLEMLQDEVMAPIKAIEARQAEIEEIRCIPGSATGLASDGIKAYIGMLEEHVHDEHYWDESYSAAFDAINEARRALNDMLAAAEKAEQEKRELEELRAKQAEYERMQRENAEAEKREAEEKLRKAQAEAEAARREAEEAKRKQEQAEAASKTMESTDMLKVQQDAQKTKNDMLFPDDVAMYRKTCKTEAKEDLMKLGLTEEQARNVVIGILTNKVRHTAMVF